MRFFITNSLLFLLATTLTLAAPVTLPNQDSPARLIQGIQGVGDKNAVVSSSSTTPILHTPAQGSDDQAALVRRAPRPPVPPLDKGSVKESVPHVKKKRELLPAIGSKALKAATRLSGQFNKPPIVRNLDKTARTGQQVPKFNKFPNKSPIVRNLDKTVRIGQQHPSFNKVPIRSPNKVPITFLNKSRSKIPITSHHGIQV